MTKLIIEPFDMHEPGSHKKIRTLRKAYLAILEHMEASTGRERLKAYDDLEDLILAQSARFKTDDGTPVEEALDGLSIDQFTDLFAGLLAVRETIPPVSSGSLPSEGSPTGA
jgi:hypothetical protein